MAEAGQRVAKGSRLIVIEAMKLEHAILAARDGVLAEVFVKAGDQITEGIELLRFAEPPLAPEAKHG